MTTLVEDLLLLARLDAGRPLERADVDLTRLVLDAVSDAHAAGPDHRWQLDLPDEPVTVPGDASRLTQVLTNLLANARTHTPPGTTVTVSLGRGDDGHRAGDGGRRRARASRRTCCRTSSSGSPAAPRRARGRTAAPGWAWRSCARSSRRTAATVSVTSRPGRTEFAVRLPHGRAPRRAPLHS